MGILRDLFHVTPPGSRSAAIDAVPIASRNSFRAMGPLCFDLQIGNAQRAHHLIRCGGRRVRANVETNRVHAAIVAFGAHRREFQRGEGNRSPKNSHEP